MSGQCPATRRYAHPDTGHMTGLQCKYAPGHQGDHAADPGTGTGDLFWPPGEGDIIVRTGWDGSREGEEDHIRKMAAAAMANPGQFVYGP